ncbi:hypothetical protein MMC26_003761 [Xylographa opegraphella]|nr:hypothetical protein [Xylographa opegraphella]
MYPTRRTLIAIIQSSSYINRNRESDVKHRDLPTNAAIPAGKRIPIMTDRAAITTIAVRHTATVFFSRRATAKEGPLGSPRTTAWCSGRGGSVAGGGIFDQGGNSEMRSGS